MKKMNANQIHRPLDCGIPTLGVRGGYYLGER